jgi:carboxypeptidase Q
MGRNDEQDSLKAVEPYLHNIGSDRLDSSTDLLLDSDQAPFVGFGVPALLLWTELTNYRLVHHKASDTFESVCRQNLMQAVVTTAVTAYSIADSEDSFARHFSPDEVRDLFQKSGQEADYFFAKKVGLIH